MTTIRLTEALAIVADAAGRDPALRSMVAARLGLRDPSIRDIGPKPVGLPDLSTLTALQITLFDNGPKPVAAQIEYWTEEGYALPRKNGYAKMTTVKLFPQKRFLQNLRKQRSATVSPEWIEVMREIALSEGEDRLYGPIFVSKPGHGSGYIEGQIIIAELIDGAVAEVRIVASPRALTATAFTTRSHLDKALAANAIGSARLALHGDDNIDWATEAGLVV